MSASRLLVVGGTGLLGRNLTRWASTAGHSVVATHLSSSPISLPEVEWRRCDVLDASAVLELVASTGVDLVINTAYRQSGPDASQVCDVGAGNVATAAAASGVRLIHLSTDLVFDGALGRPYVEADDVSPLNEYGRAKANAERRVLTATDDALVVRTSLIYGEATGPQELLVGRALSGEDISFFTDEWRNPVEVRALAATIGTVAESDITGLLHLAGPSRVNRLDFARFLARRLGGDPSILRGRPANPADGPRPKDVSLASTRTSSLGVKVGSPEVV